MCYCRMYFCMTFMCLYNYITICSLISLIYVFYSIMVLACLHIWILIILRRIKNGSRASEVLTGPLLENLNFKYVWTAQRLGETINTIKQRSERNLLIYLVFIFMWHAVQLIMYMRFNSLRRNGSRNQRICLIYSSRT